MFNGNGYEDNTLPYSTKFNIIIRDTQTSRRKSK